MNETFEYLSPSSNTIQYRLISPLNAMSMTMPIVADTSNKRRIIEHGKGDATKFQIDNEKRY